jgi:hypothetical protein
MEHVKTVWKDLGGSYVAQLKRKPIAIENFLTDFTWNIEIPINEENLPLKQTVKKVNNGDPLSGMKKKNTYSTDVRNPKAILKF